MSLSPSEQQVLDRIERELDQTDPELAARMASVGPEHRRRRISFARLLLGLGAVLTLVGLAASRGLVSLGALACLYGVLMMVTGAVMAVRARGGRRQRPRR